MFATTHILRYRESLLLSVRISSGRIPQLFITYFKTGYLNKRIDPALKLAQMGVQKSAQFVNNVKN